MATNDDSKMIVIHEGVWRSVAKDSFTAVLAFALIGPGILVGSSALQWIGALIFMLLIVNITLRTLNKNRLTLDEAKDFIDAMIAERGRGS